MNFIVEGGATRVEDVEIEFIDKDTVTLIQRPEESGEEQYVVLTGAMLKAVAAMVFDYQSGGRLPEGVRVERQRKAA